jgi:hypothetical protein
LSEENIVFNTSLKPCEIAPHRLVRVRLTRKTEGGHFVTQPLTVTEENYKYTTFPIDHFVKHLPTQKGRQDMMTPAMKNAFNMLLRLHERAMFHNVEKWSNLPKSCLPVTWFDRTRNKSVANPTGDGGCSICTWEYGKIPLDMPDPDVKVPTTPTTKSKSKKRVRSSLANTDDEGVFGECVQPPTKKKRSRKGELEVTDPTILLVNTSKDNQLPTPPSGRKSCPAGYLLSSDSDSSAEVWQEASSDSEDDVDSCDDPHYSPGSVSFS